MHNQLTSCKFLLFILFYFTLSGCAIFKGENVPETFLIPIEKTDQIKPTISYNITVSGFNYSAAESSKLIQNVISGELLQALEQSEYFSRISKNDIEAEINLSVTFVDSANPAALIPAFITGLSLFTIPSWATEKFIVTAVAKNKNGNSKQYVVEDSITMVQWLPMIFIFPVKNFTAIPQVRKNIYRNILMKMKNDGLIYNLSPQQVSAQQIERPGNNTLQFRMIEDKPERAGKVESMGKSPAEKLKELQQFPATPETQQ